MVETTEFDFTTVVINVNSQEPEVNPTPEEIKKYCTIHGPGQITWKIEDTDKLTKLTVGDLLVRFFDTITFTKPSQLGNYSGIINQINQAKKDGKESIKITKEEKDGLIEIFSQPPKEPKLNSTYMFIVHCLEKKLENPIEK